MTSIILLLQYIAKTKLFGFLPLDILCHTVLGGLLVLVFRRLKISWTASLLLLFVLELIKELFDSRVIGSTMTEHLKDFFFTFLWPALIYWRDRKIRQKKL